jgi:hypothetical protein
MLDLLREYVVLAGHGQATAGYLGIPMNKTRQKPAGIVLADKRSRMPASSKADLATVTTIVVRRRSRIPLCA